MANFDETIQWIDVIKPVNTDYNVAEKTVLTFLEPHGLIVGDYVIEQSSNANGIVYEVVDNLVVNVARQDETEFPYSGIVTNGTIYPTYIYRTVEHGINNQVVQDLVDRTAYNKKGVDDVEQDITGIEQDITDLEETIANLSFDHNELTNIQGGVSGEYYHLSLSKLDSLDSFIDGTNSNLYGFTEIRVGGEQTVKADKMGDNLTLIAGDNISIDTNSYDDSVTITAHVDIPEYEPTPPQDIFKSVYVEGSSTCTADSATDMLTLRAGSNISMSADSTSDTITISATIPPQEGATSNCYSTIQVMGGDSVVAESPEQRLVLIGGDNIDIIADPDTDSITISSPTAVSGDPVGGTGYVITDVSMTATKNTRIVATVNGSAPISITMPTAPVEGDWVEVVHGGSRALDGNVYLYASTYSFYGTHSSIEIDVLYTSYIAIFQGGSWQFVV